MSPAEESPFHDITDSTEFPPLSDLPPLVIFLSLALLIGVGILLFKKKASRSQTTKSPPSPYQEALQHLPQIETQATTEPIGKTASRLSLLLRRTLQKTTNSPTLFQTQREFQVHTNALNLTSLHHTKRATTLLEKLWRLEYAPPSTDSPCSQDLIAETKALLEDLTPPSSLSPHQ